MEIKINIEILLKEPMIKELMKGTQLSSADEVAAFLKGTMCTGLVPEIGGHEDTEECEVKITSEVFYGKAQEN